MSYAPTMGNQPSDTEKIEMRTRASQKYGTAWRNVDAGMMWSTQVPRFQPTQAPRPTPRRNAMIVASPTRPTVQGRVSPSSWLTGAGKYRTDVPRSPVKMFFQYARYC